MSIVNYYKALLMITGVAAEVGHSVYSRDKNQSVVLYITMGSTYSIHAFRNTAFGYSLY